MCFDEDLLFISLNGHCVTKQEFALNVCLVVVAVFIILINLLAVLTLIKHTDMQEPTNYFIANLAVADTAIGFFVIYDALYNVLQFKYYIECVLRVGLFISVNIASVLNLTVLTLDRYIKVTRPYRYVVIFTSRKVKVAEALIWIFSIACGLLPFCGWSTMKLVEICNFFGIMSWSYLLFILSVFSIPSSVITFVYINFVIVAKRHRAAIRTQMSSVPGYRRERNAWKSFKTAFLIVGAYFICWGPVGVFMLIVIVSDIEKSMSTSPNVIFVYLLGIGIFNSILNPIIYATKISVFRRTLRRMFCVTRLQEFKRNSLRSLSNAFRNQVQDPRGSTASRVSNDDSSSRTGVTRSTQVHADENNMDAFRNQVLDPRGSTASRVSNDDSRMGVTKTTQENADENNKTAIVTQEQMEQPQINDTVL